MTNKNEPIIQVKHLSKEYKIGIDTTYKTLSESIIDTLRSPLSVLKNFNKQNESFWALKDVNFEVNRGEVVGIIGRNGAGKSTLLKVLSRITHPTEGEVRLRGRVGSLLEVGTGFHPELTGRENVYFNGAILGMKKREIEDKFEEIVKFSGVEKFLDTPVKRYSSGMYVRLAFAVAAHMDPEILIVDEVLAVGDAAFQKKCIGKMSEVAEGGRTVLFVSHNMGAVRSLCERSLMLSEGQVVKDGASGLVIDNYLSNHNKSTILSGEISWELNKAPGSEDFRLRKIELLASNGEIQSAFAPQESINICIHYQILKLLTGLRVVLQILTSTGEIAFTSTDHLKRNEDHYRLGRYISICCIPGGLMNLGEYSVRVWAGNPGIQYFLEPTDFISFSIVGIGTHGSTFEDSQKWPGVVCPMLEWKIVVGE